MANTATMNNNTTVPVLNNVIAEMNENERNNNEMETITNNTNETVMTINENEVDLADVLETLLETSSNESDSDKMESKTWNEPYFLDSTGASKALKEWADRISDSFEEHSDNGIIHNIHPDYTAVRVPVRFHRELRKLGIARDYRSSGTYLWEGVWYFPADREFLELMDSE